MGTIDAADAESRRMGRKHVFVVNGEPDFLHVMRDLLQGERYNVTTTNFVPQTFDQIAALRPDLLIVDLAVGDRAGWELLERLQAEALTRGVPVVVTSTERRLLERAEADGWRYGGQRFVVKPMDLDVVLRAIEDLIGPA